MRIAGGIIALVVGLIQLIISATAAFFVDVAGDIVQAAAESNQQQVEAQEAMASAAIWVYVSLAVGLLTFIFGILAIAQKKPSNGMVIIVLGIVGVVMAILGGGGIIGLLWPGLIVLAGVFAFIGAKQPA
ncbi:MAG: hypothetical protein H6843_07925 [Rhodospirillaceae bacterium]|nr:hypothetical protein [Rhodospirillaceae bacterium]